MARKIAKGIFVLLTLMVVGLHVYEVVVKGAPPTHNLARVIGCVLVCGITLFRDDQSRVPLVFFEKAYKEIIGKAFENSKSNRRRLLQCAKYVHLKQWKKAETQAEKLKERCITSDDRRAVYTFSALIHMDMGENEEAIQEYEELVNRGIADYSAYNNLGLLYKREGDMAQAKRCYETSVSLNPRYATAYSNLAWVNFRTGEMEKAREMAEKSLKLDGNLYSALEVLALVTGIEGDKASSDKYIQRAVAAGSKNKKVLEEMIAQYEEDEF